MGMMRESFIPVHDGVCKVQRAGDPATIDARIQFRWVETGRSRMREWSQVDVQVDGKGFVGRSPLTGNLQAMHAALQEVAKECQEQGYQLRVAGVSGWECESDSEIFGKLGCLDDVGKALSVMRDLGFAYLRPEAVARLYCNTVTIGEPHYPDRSAAGEIEVEVGTKSDWDHCMDVIDALLPRFPRDCSSGLSRVARFKTAKDFMTFLRHLSLALLAGHYALSGRATELRGVPFSSLD